MNTITDKGYNQNLFNILHNLGVLASVDDMNVIIECVMSMKEGPSEAIQESPTELESLPERFGIILNDKNSKKIRNHFRISAWLFFGKIYHFPIHNNFHTWPSLQPGYTLITDEQFDRCVLKKKTIMEDKELSIEEKKQLWKALQVVREIAVKEMYKCPLDQEKDCAPLFYTSIDNIPVWPKDVVWAIVNNRPTSFNAEDIFNEGFETAKSFEAAEKQAFLNSYRI